jgi:hypothetical protein
VTLSLALALLGCVDRSDPDYVASGEDGDGAASCDASAGSGWTAGKIPEEELTGTDQDGNTFGLSDYCDRGVVVVAVTLHGSSSSALSEAQTYWDEWGPDSLMVVGAIGEDAEYQTPDAADLQETASSLQLGYPVIADAGFAWTLHFVSGDLTLPLAIYLAPGGKIDGGGDLSRTAVEAILP